MAVYTRQIQSAKRMIAKYGQFCTWTEPGQVEKNPDEPWNNEPSADVVHEKIKIAFFPNNQKTLARAIGGDVTFGNSLAYMAAVNFTPSNDHTITKADGSKATIVDIDEINVNGESILFIIECNQ